MDTLSLFVFLLSVTTFCEAANILYVIPFTSKSHYIMLRPIGLELAKRGHNVTVITAFKEIPRPPNYHEVVIDNKEIWEVIGDERPNIFEVIDLPSESFLNKILWTGGAAFSEVALNSSEVKYFLKNDNKFDLVIVEQFFLESLYALAHKYNAPLVLVTTFGNCMRHNILTRNPLQLETVIQEFLEVYDPLSFWGRFKNVYFTLYEFVWFKYWYLEKHEQLVRKYIPDLEEPVPSLYDIQKNTALMLINSHFSFDNPVAYGPHIVEIGGIHMTQSNLSLPKDLQDILDGAKHGVVYVNFGTNVRSSELPVEKRDAFLNVFRQLKELVIWKWEDEYIENKPENLYIAKWLPQKELLSHPNIKVFISHGGLIGTQEAIFHGIPIIGIPIYADQYNNLLQAQDMQFGKVLRYHDINEKNLKRIIEEVLKDNTYKIKAQEISARFKDRPMSAMDTAMFWIEYIIRNKGAKYLKQPRMNLSWIAYNMLDVYGFIILILIIAIFSITKLIIMISRVLVVKEDKNRSKNKKL